MLRILQNVFLKRHGMPTMQQVQPTPLALSHVALLSKQPLPDLKKIFDEEYQNNPSNSDKAWLAVYSHVLSQSP